MTWYRRLRIRDSVVMMTWYRRLRMRNNFIVMEGERVCDPMCGAGIVIGQAAQDYPQERWWEEVAGGDQATFLGFDKDAAQLERCSCNLQK
eukprot:gene25743-31490_t